MPILIRFGISHLYWYQIALTAPGGSRFRNVVIKNNFNLEIPGIEPAIVKK